MAKKPLVILILFIISLSIIAKPLKRVKPEDVGLNSKRLENADAIIQKAIDNKEIPGAVLAVVRYNKMAYIKAYGNKQIYPTPIPMTENTVFDMASVSKSMSTAICAMILVDRGKIRLDDNVKIFIPDFKGWMDKDGKTTEIKIIDIMTHTSGLPPYAPVAECKKKYGSPNKDGLIDYIANCKRDFKPETAFQYSCLNYITLQKIIEVVTNKDLATFAKENIFDVLDMENTCYNPTGKILSLCAPTEKQADGKCLTGKVHDPLARIMNGGVSGNAGVFSNADDIAILSATIMNKGFSVNGKHTFHKTHNHKIQLLSPLAIKKMCTVPEKLKQFGRTPGWDLSSPYASDKGDLFSANTFGHTGYTGTSLIIDPDNKIAVILLTNRVHPRDKGGIVRLRALVANAVAGAITDCCIK